MNKKLMIIYSSPKDTSVSKEIVKHIVNEIPRNFIISEWNAYDIMAKPCYDCGHCSTMRGCFMNDLDDFFREFEESDCVIFASPVYNKSFPAPLKAILDRFQHYYNLHFKHGVKPTIEKPKSCGIVLSSGAIDEDAYKHMDDTIAQCLSVLNGKINARIISKSTDTHPTLPDLFMIKNFVLKLIISTNQN